eukprot:gene22372-biopygen4227
MPVQGQLAKNAIIRPVVNYTGNCTFLSPGRSNCRSGCNWEYICLWATLGAIHHSVSERRAVYASVNLWETPIWMGLGPQKILTKKHRCPDMFSPKPKEPTSGWPGQPGSRLGRPLRDTVKESGVRIYSLAFAPVRVECRHNNRGAHGVSVSSRNPITIPRSFSNNIPNKGWNPWYTRSLKNRSRKGDGKVWENSRASPRAGGTHPADRILVMLPKMGVVAALCKQLCSNVTEPSMCPWPCQGFFRASSLQG